MPIVLADNESVLHEWEYNVKKATGCAAKKEGSAVKESLLITDRRLVISAESNDLGVKRKEIKIHNIQSIDCDYRTIEGKTKVMLLWETIAFLGIAAILLLVGFIGFLINLSNEIINLAFLTCIIVGIVSLVVGIILFTVLKKKSFRITIHTAPKEGAYSQKKSGVIQVRLNADKATASEIIDTRGSIIIDRP